MIRFVTSNDERFKSLKFNPGLNVVLADITDVSTDQDSRNGTGKSSLLQLFHYLLGANVPKTSLFRSPGLLDHSFAMGLDFDGATATIVRSPNRSHAHLYSQESKPIELKEFPEFDVFGRLPGGWREISFEQWKQKLASEFFDLDPDLPKHSPTCRTLLAYLIRDVKSGGFAQPFKNNHYQTASGTQVAISFLLGFDWSIPVEFAEVREEQKRIDNLKKVANDPDLGSVIGTVAELRTEVAVARKQAEKLRGQASQFTVVGNYEEFVQEADQLTRRLRDLRNDDAIDRDLMTDIAAARRREVPPGAVDLERMWGQVNILLPDLVRSRYDQVKAFHESVIANRRLYLGRESDRAEERISQRQSERQRLDQRRSELMQLLTSSRALDQFTALESEAARAEGEVRELQRRLERAESIEGHQLEIDGRLRELLLELQADHRDRFERRDRAIVLFDDYSRGLYDERHGSLIIGETLKGPEFDVEIAGQGSVGIDSMQIFCFDMVVMTVLCEREIGPRFLVHDSHIFDGVDERQVANALMLGARLADAFNFQYIVTLNSDSIPSFPNEFGFNSYVNEVRLTDATDDGGLFGFRFD